ncbi:MAG TPA: hypothetical protein VKU89_07140 [Solirubrobacteraceae bacterium]|nr:hypothetical protein [Solirubrobacteraceae bacterium]
MSVGQSGRTGAHDGDSAGSADQHYQELLALVEQQLLLAEAGSADALVGLAAAWERISALGPVNPTPAAASALARAALLLRRTSERIEHMQASLGEEITRTAKVAHAARSYASPAPSLSRRVDRRA